MVFGCDVIIKPDGKGSLVIIVISNDNNLF